MGCGSSNTAGSLPHEKLQDPPPTQKQVYSEQNHKPQEQETKPEEKIQEKEAGKGKNDPIVEETKAEAEEKTENEKEEENEEEEEEQEREPSDKEDEKPEDEESEEPETQEELVVLERDDVIKAVVRGQINVKYPLTQKLVRIFTSSTFTG